MFCIDVACEVGRLIGMIICCMNVTKIMDPENSVRGVLTTFFLLFFAINVFHRRTYGLPLISNWIVLKGSGSAVAQCSDQINRDWPLTYR